MTDDGTAKLMDFGSAINIVDAKGTVMIATTPFYCSPEVFKWNQDQENNPLEEFFSLDVWAIGVMLYRLLTISFPFNPDKVNFRPLSFVVVKFTN